MSRKIYFKEVHMSTKPTHLTQHQRSVIEALLGEQNSLRHIADRIAKAPSTVSREVRNHTKVVVPKCCDCTFCCIYPENLACSVDFLYYLGKRHLLPSRDSFLSIPGKTQHKGVQCMKESYLMYGARYTADIHFW